jgi:hypothetical protein
MEALAAALADFLQMGARSTKWLCQTDSGWSQYSDANSKIIEGAFATQPFVDLDINGKSYRVDFKKMVQTNISTSYSRAVQRILTVSFLFLACSEVVQNKTSLAIIRMPNGFVKRITVRWNMTQRIKRPSRKPSSKIKMAPLQFEEGNMKWISKR